MSRRKFHFAFEGGGGSFRCTLEESRFINFRWSIFDKTGHSVPIYEF